MDPLVWAVILMVLGLALVMLEIFIPSGGILGFLAVCSIFGSIFVAFSGGGSTRGFVFVLIALVGLPTAVVLALKWLPNTPIGRRLLLRVPDEDEVLPEDDPRDHLSELIGHTGISRTVMLPGGTVKIGNETHEAVSESGSIDQGDTVQVVQVRNNRLVVRKAAAPAPPENPDDILSQPIDQMGIDPFDEPLS